MCAICGIIYFNNQKVDESHLIVMSDLMKHRGPDDKGTFISPDNKVGFGFRRLSIIDLNNGNQPINNSTKDLSIIFNGEIYNYLELRKKLKMKGYTFSTQTDTETILIGYEEWGEDIVHQLR